MRWAVGATSACALLLGAILKLAVLAPSTRRRRPATAEAATGLGHLGTVRPLDPPHTQPNFVMREMGYQVARRHAEKLRGMAAVLLFLRRWSAMLLLLHRTAADRAACHRRWRPRSAWRSAC